MHGPIGITVAVLAFSQLLLAFARPKPEAPHRLWWNWQHWFTGRAAVCLAMINVVIGVQVCGGVWGWWNWQHWFTGRAECAWP